MCQNFGSKIIMANVIYGLSKQRFMSVLNQSKILWQSQNNSKLLPSTSIVVGQNRNSSFLTSHPVRNLEEYPEVEVVRNPPEWKYVERLLTQKTVPLPTPKPEYPSKWTPPKQIDPTKMAYFVERTRNYMVPVYLERTYRGMRRITVVRRIQGDLWKLEQELRELIESTQNGKICASRVNEMSGQIRFHGDYVNLIKCHLTSKGF